MNIELITIGDEILSGFILNTNVYFMSQELYKRGYLVARHTTLPDEKIRLKRGLQEALERADLVITTGGIGPTVDDLTRDLMAEIFHSELYLDERVREDLKKRFQTLPISIEQQSTVPRKAEVLLNKIGTAPAFIFEKRCIVLPGVPYEMRHFFREDILPFIAKHYPLKERLEREELYFCQISESLLDEKIGELLSIYPEVHIGIYPNAGLASVTLTTHHKSSLEAVSKALREHFHTYLMPTLKIEAALLQLFKERNQTLALAESCTGGMMAHKITSQAGSSCYFLGSLVVYTNLLKQTLLGVSAKTLTEKGAVSRETVEEMASGLLRITEADYGVAVSGIAGPTGGTPEKPVGTIWAAIAQRGGAIHTWTFSIQMEREPTILVSSHKILSALYRCLAYGIQEES